VVAEFIAGRLSPVVDSVYDLEHSADAMARLASGAQFGKIAVRISE
jgi:hypothetical protein